MNNTCMNHSYILEKYVSKILCKCTKPYGVTDVQLHL